MFEYLLRLALLLPLLAGLIWGSLWLTRMMQSRLCRTARRRYAWGWAAASTSSKPA